MTAARRDPRSLVESFESTLGESRRRLGAHYTPEALAERLVDLALSEFDRLHAGSPRSVCDPSCGAGSILLAAADALVDRGMSPEQVLRSVRGFDTDPASVAMARTALSGWAEAHGLGSPPEPLVAIGDALGADSGEQRFDVVVGNPPFASPLDRDVAARRRAGATSGSETGSPVVTAPSTAASAYTDDAALHLLAAVRWCVPGGVVCMLQPQSVLGARDAAGVRASVLELADIGALWASDEAFFEHASVEVCALVLIRHASGGGTGPEPAEGEPAHGSPGSGPGVMIHWRDRPTTRAVAPGSGSWAPLLAVAMGHPRGIGSAGVPSAPLGELATCTAGFREEFYVLAECAHEDVPAPERGGAAGRVLQLVTSGLIDPGVNRWGSKHCRIGGRSFEAPVAELDQVAKVSPRVARWCADRSSPKLLVASQTRVLEVCLDRSGATVPLTPVVSVQSHGVVPAEALAAVLSAPSSSLALTNAAAGTGLSSSAVRVGAPALREIEVPTDPETSGRAVELWAGVERLASAGSTYEEWFELGTELDALSGRVRSDVVEWWVSRLPRSVRRQRT